MKIKHYLLMFILSLSLGWFAGSVSAFERNFPVGPQGPAGLNGTDGTNGSDASIDPNDYQRGSAAAMAMGAHQFDFSTTKTQVSGSTAYYQGPSALSIGIAKRRGRALYSGSLATTTGGGNAAAAAIGFQF